MKKAVFILAASLIAILAVVSAANWGLPDLKQCSPAAAGPGGMVYTVENGPFFSSIYGLAGDGQIAFFYRERNLCASRRITQLAWSGDTLYFLREYALDGGGAFCEPVMLDADGTPAVQGSVQLSGSHATGLTAPAFVAAVSTGGGAAVYNGADGGSAVLIQTPLEDTRILSASYLADSGAMLVLLDTGAAATIDRGVRYEVQPPQAAVLPDHIQCALSTRLLCKLPLLALVVLCVLVLGLLAILAALLCARIKRLAVRITAACAGFLLLALCLMAGLLLWQTALDRLDNRLEQAVQSGARLSSTLSTMTPSSVLWGIFRGSDTQDRYANLLSTGVENELYALQMDQSLTVAVSARSPFGLPVERSCPAEVAELARRAANGGTAAALLHLQGRWTAACAHPFFSNGVQVGVLLTRTGADDIVSSLVRSLSVLAAAGLTVFVAACLLLLLLLWRVTRPLGQLARQMEAVSEGEIKLKPIQAGLDEVGEMARTMQEMCMALSIQKYEVNTTIHSYRRFVPRGLAKLLDRASIMEVSFGDISALSGQVGLLSVSNWRTARGALEDGPFVDFVNGCFGAVHRTAVSHGGYLLSAGFDLDAVKLYYEGSPASAVASGLDLLGEAQGSAASAAVAPDFFLLLHRTEFLYGIAGTQDEVFPFLSSQEMEFLSAYEAHFAGTGVHIVLTGAFLKDLEPGYTTRYIGFVLAGSGVRYELYEVLDAYPDLERNLRLRYDSRFQEAIQLFYHSDFYLARNLFSTLLRSCPGDGIARWYLFACEHFFNAEVPGERNYQLFGVDWDR